MEDLRAAARTAISLCMGLRPKESLLVITDRPLRGIGMAFFEEGIALGAEAMLLEMIPRRMHGEEPPKAIAEIMKYADVVLIPTSKSLSHTNARREASRLGARIATLPGITEESMKRTLMADYEAIAERSLEFAQLLTQAKEARVISPAGTDIVMSLEGRSGYPDTGIYHNPGDFGNLPAGEAYIAPVEGTAEGVIVVDGSMSAAGLLEEPITMKVERGQVTSIQGGNAAKRLEEAIRPLGVLARNIAELGIGTNDRAILTGNVLEDEKVLGTIHIAIGDNSGFGGKIQVESHLDGVIKNPTLLLDGKEVTLGGVR